MVTSLAKSARDEDSLDLEELASAPPSVLDVVLDLSTPLYPTETADIVGTAVRNLFPNVDLAVADGRMMGRGTGPASLARFRRRLREMRIRDTARGVLRGGTRGGEVVLALNKQSAVARVPNFATGGAPLGDIEVTIRTADPAALIEWLCELDED